MNDKKKQYRCTECGMHYSGEELSQRCQQWCSKNKSCNLEIIKHSTEAKESKGSNES